MVIKHNKYYDPEGLGITPKGKIVCQGNEQECRNTFNKIVNEVRKKEDGKWVSIDSVTDDTLIIYYPQAVSKEVYQLVQQSSTNDTSEFYSTSVTEIIRDVFNRDITVDTSEYISANDGKQPGGFSKYSFQVIFTNGFKMSYRCEDDFKNAVSTLANRVKLANQNPRNISQIYVGV